jgi:pSer/pThr/pTyr-binding forkhead associated (FHA) protein
VVERPSSGCASPTTKVHAHAVDTLGDRREGLVAVAQASLSGTLGGSLPNVVVRTGPLAGRRVELGSELVIGRQDTDIVVEDPEVSRRHAVLRRSGDSVVIEDLNSTNGTFVNRERIRTPITVHPGDELRVGGTTFEIEADWRAAQTMVSLPLRPDQIRAADARPSPDLVAEREDEITTQPLPRRVRQSGVRPARSKKGWVAVGVVVLAAIVAAIAYLWRTDLPAESDFATRANDACTSVRQSGNGLDLGGDPTRLELERARTIRLDALSGIRDLGQPEQDAEQMGRFLSAFGKTNASIVRLEAAAGSDNRKVARARRGLRADVRAERELAVTAGLAACGGLGIR